jgi:hypothetical protein
MSVEQERQEESPKLKEIYTKDPFYEMYTSFNQQ